MVLSCLEKCVVWVHKRLVMVVHQVVLAHSPSSEHIVGSCFCPSLRVSRWGFHMGLHVLLDISPYGAV